VAWRIIRLDIWALRWNIIEMIPRVTVSCSRLLRSELSAIIPSYAENGALYTPRSRFRQCLPDINLKTGMHRINHRKNLMCTLQCSLLHLKFILGAFMLYSLSTKETSLDRSSPSTEKTERIRYGKFFLVSRLVSHTRSDLLMLGPSFPRFEICDSRYWPMKMRKRV
jgi:hypothetical protein